MHPLVKYRKDKKINQHQLADLLGISQQRVSYYEKGMEVPSHVAKVIFEKTGINLISNERQEVSNKDSLLIEHLQRELEAKNELISEMRKRLSLMERLMEKEKAL